MVVVPAGLRPCVFICAVVRLAPRGAHAPTPAHRRRRLRRAAAAAAAAEPGPLDRPADRARRQGRAARPTAPPPPRPTRPPQVKQAIWAANTLQDKPYLYGGGHKSFSSTPRLRLLRHRLLRAARRRPARRARSTPARFMQWGEQRPGRLDHRLHEPRPRLRRDRRPAARHERRPAIRARAQAAPQQAFERGPRWRPTPRSARGFVKRHPPSAF